METYNPSGTPAFFSSAEGACTVSILISEMSVFGMFVSGCRVFVQVTVQYDKNM